ncbi:unnamed protein product [Coregonus sp. 'balchen']|nr:unnamed protein product [Coregonus sp. 'balchen']
MSTSPTPKGTPVQRSPSDGAPSMMMVTPINDLHGLEPSSMVKGERLMRCKLASVHRLLDLYGWAQLSHTCLTVKVNILGEVVERGSTTLGVDLGSFSLHSAIYSTRPDVRCLLHLHTPATAAVSAMKCGLLPLSHEALLVGEVAYYDYNGLMEDEEDRVLVLRNHGIVALGESVSALCSAGGEQNLIMLDRSTHKPNAAGTVGWAGSTFGPLTKSRLGEHEFEALMRTLDNLRSRTRKEVEVPATVHSFQFEEEGVHPLPRQHPYAQRQQQEKTRWLNTPNSYLRVNQDQASPGHQRTTWLKTEEMQQGSGAIKIENSNQFVPLFTNPQEVLETRNKIRQQNRQDMKTAGPQSQVLAGVITDDSPPSPDPAELAKLEPETPNPFNQLTDKELEEYRKEVQRKAEGQTDVGDEVENENESPPATSPTNNPHPCNPPPSDETKTDSTAVQNGKGEEEKKTTEELEKGMKALSTNNTSTPPAAPPTKLPGNTPEGSPSKSPSKKKKKFKAPSFLKKSKKKEQKEKAET